MIQRYFILSLGFMVHFCNCNVFEQTPYQDIIVHNVCIQPGERSCTPSYALIKKKLESVAMPFSVLDIGAAQGYFSFKITYDFQALCVMLEGDYDYQNHTKQLLTLCHKNNLPNTIFLRQKITPKVLRELAAYEHFDVVLALNFIHHAGCDWKELTDAILLLGNQIIIEHPPFDEYSTINDETPKRRAIENYLLQKNAQLLGEVGRHTSTTKKSKIYCITKKEFQLSKQTIKKSTFDNFGGVYPSPLVSTYIQ